MRAEIKCVEWKLRDGPTVSAEKLPAEIRKTKIASEKKQKRKEKRKKERKQLIRLC